MNKYYLHDGTENIGPFDIEELKQQNITRNTQVWCEGMEDWKEAGTIEELKTIFPVLPPPLKKSKTEVPKQDKSSDIKDTIYWKIYKFMRILAIIFVVIMGIFIVANVLENKTNTSSTYEESVMTIQEIEAANPLNYLQADGSYRENFIGDKIKIDGSITNTATVTTYKDVTVRVNFYSKTNTLIGSEDYTLYEFYPANSKQKFKLKVKAYSNVSSLGWEVIKASVK